MDTFRWRFTNIWECAKCWCIQCIQCLHQTTKFSIQTPFVPKITHRNSVYQLKTGFNIGVAVTGAIGRHTGAPEYTIGSGAMPLYHKGLGLVLELVVVHQCGRCLVITDFIDHSTIQRRPVYFLSRPDSSRPTTTVVV